MLTRCSFVEMLHSYDMVVRRINNETVTSRRRRSFVAKTQQFRCRIVVLRCHMDVTFRRICDVAAAYHYESTAPQFRRRFVEITLPRRPRYVQINVPSTNHIFSPRQIGRSNITSTKMCNISQWQTLTLLIRERKETLPTEREYP